jgi:stage IV sporulation protein FB
LRIAKVAGMPISVNNWLIVMFALFAGAGMGFKVVMVFVSVLWHEMAHALTARYLGLRVREIRLLPFGGVACIEGIGCAGTFRDVLIAAAGPLASLVMAAFIYLQIYWGEPKEWQVFLIKTNLMLLGFNLLPALPLDGGRITRAWLAGYVNYVKATLACVWIGRGVSILLLTASLYEFWSAGTINLTFLIAAIFLHVTGGKELSLAGFHNMAVMANKKAALMNAGMLPVIHIAVVRRAPVREVIRLFTPDQYHMVLVVDGNCRVCATLTETAIWEGIQAKGISPAVGDFI